MTDFERGYEMGIADHAATIAQMGFRRVTLCRFCKDYAEPGICCTWGARTDPDGWCYEAEREERQ